LDLKIQGKNAIVTGAAGDIGKATVICLAEGGANVLVTDMNEQAAIRTVEELQPKYPDVKLVPQVCNVTDKASVDAMVEAALKVFGRIDILDNIAGMSTKVDFLEMPEEIYDQMMDVNAKGTFLVDQAVLRVMIPNKSGKIVNMSSMSGKEGYPTNVAYSASKFAVTGMTQAIAKYAAPYNINVNCVCPGIVHTHIWDRLLDDVTKAGGDAEAYWNERIGAIPLKRAQTAEDIAHMFVYLSSALADNMTGQGINVTGGLILH
jgi:meso-butanediol dehydrogenase / (S,S)-butanediol dehydrogenase / diacetyl reductase